MIRISTPGERRPSVVLSCSSVSSIDGAVAIGNSVSPQLEHTPRPPSTSCTSRWSSGELGAPPPTHERSRGNNGSGPCLRCAAMYAWKNGIALPRRVAPCSAIRSGLSLGVEDVEQDEAIAGEQRRGDDRDAADVRDREGHRIDVVGCRRVAGDEPVRARHHGRIGVPHTLRVAGRSGRVVQPACGQLGRVAKRCHGRQASTGRRSATHRRSRGSRNPASRRSSRASRGG